MSQIIEMVCRDWSVVRFLSNINMNVCIFIDVTLRNANQGYCRVTGSLDQVAYEIRP